MLHRGVFRLAELLKLKTNESEKSRRMQRSKYINNSHRSETGKMFVFWSPGAFMWCRVSAAYWDKMKVTRYQTKPSTCLLLFSLYPRPIRPVARHLLWALINIKPCSISELTQHAAHWPTLLAFHVPVEFILTPALQPSRVFSNVAPACQLERVGGARKICLGVSRWLILTSATVL